jgi:hypothetical protein
MEMKMSTTLLGSKIVGAIDIAQDLASILVLSELAIIPWNSMQMSDNKF